MILAAYNHHDLINSCKVIGGSDWQDIRSEITTKMLEMPNERIKTIDNILAYMVTSAYRISIDNKRKIKETVSHEAIEVIIDEVVDNSKIIRKLKHDMNHPKRFYHARVFYSCLFEYKSIKAYSQKVGIPYNEVRTTYIDYKNYIKEWLKESGI